MTTAYRDDRPAILARREELLRTRGAEVDAAAAGLVAILARRKARWAAGVTATAGTVAVAVAAVASRTHGAGGYERDGTATELLVASWLLALVVWAIVRITAGRALKATLVAWSERTEDARSDVARLEGPNPLEPARRKIDRLEVASIAAPLIGVAMLLPLSLHLAVVSVGEGTWRPAGFDRWIELSLMLVGHVHLVFAGMCWRYARRLRRVGAHSARGPVIEAYTALLAAALAAVLPTVVFAPVIVVFTGAVPAPLMFWFAERVALRERAALGVSDLPAERWCPPRLDRPDSTAQQAFPCV
jgi:hypothetical protein